MEGELSPGAQASHQYSETVQLAISYISEHYLEPLKIKDIACHVHISPSYFSRLFKRTTGCTVAEYITKLKLRVAKELLAGTVSPLGEIAQTTGFCSQSYFTKTFKQIEGMTSLEYRRNMRMDQ
ncbi:helix-turn-helix transcriptional regulator [Paenibacillus cremeus]|uniref:Helix-turn-helix transcriptional regulator n=1 Tax=Paenibacillus cremeus TaxID=2163881 RepID=A0A559JFB5_9BACL|nr:AraC family transcriptional regulator [Paenibacillus cremeus]TVX98572.1 helix-turn-helix transcriptional regulator [Paenibacillus cremeus]